MKFFCIMNIRLLIALFLIGVYASFAQTKVSGYVYDVDKEPVSFANVIFSGSTQGTIKGWIHIYTWTPSFFIDDLTDTVEHDHGIVQWISDYR